MKSFIPIAAITLVASTAATNPTTSHAISNYQLKQRRTQAASCSSRDECTRSEFCGTDGQCYPWSCQSWYKLGSWTKVGESDPSTVSLSCEAYSNGVQENLHAVVFGCQGYGPGTEIPPNGGYSQTFNRKCQADFAQQSFECYDLASNTAFSSFVSQAESNPPKACDYTEEQFAKGYPTQEDYSYQVTLYERTGTNGSSISTGPNSTATLDTNLAVLTMYASVKEKEPTPSPTTAVPSTPSPTPESTSGAHSTGSAAVASGVALLVLSILA